MTAPPVYLSGGAAVARRYPSVRRLRTMSVSWPTLSTYDVTVPVAVSEARADRLFMLAGLLYRRLPDHWTYDRLTEVLRDYCDQERPLYLDHTTDQTDRDLADVRTLSSEFSTGAAGVRAWLSGGKRAAV
jgi:hypothetical protein